MSTAAAVVTVLTALLFLAAAAMKLTGQEQSLATRDRLGVAPSQWRRIGLLEVAGALGALVGVACLPLGIAATAGLVLTALGAIASHLRVKDPLSESGFAWLALALSVAALVPQLTSA